MTFKILKQRYPTHTGEKPLSYAIYVGRKFAAYSWSLEGAMKAVLEIIKFSTARETK